MKKIILTLILFTTCALAQDTDRLIFAIKDYNVPLVKRILFNKEFIISHDDKLKCLEQARLTVEKAKSRTSNYIITNENGINLSASIFGLFASFCVFKEKYDHDNKNLVDLMKIQQIYLDNKVGGESPLTVHNNMTSYWNKAAILTSGFGLVSLWLLFDTLKKVASNGKNQYENAKQIEKLISDIEIK